MNRNPFLAAWRRGVIIFFGACLLAWITLFGPASCTGDSDAPDQARLDEPVQLPALGVDLAGTTVSGLSSGAYMAGQFQLAHAGIVTGAAIVAGGPYACAESAFSGIVPDNGLKFLSATRAASGCMLDTLALYGVPDPKKLAERARELSEAGKIGTIPQILSDRIYIFSGTNDSVVKPRIVAATIAFYRQLGVPETNIQAVTDVPAGHAIITHDKGASCSENASPYIVDCDYDQVGAIFTHIYDNARKPSGPSQGRFVEFEQQPFADGFNNHGLTKTGVLYVPPACEKGGCRVHIAFHGCQQNRRAHETAFIRDAGYARWADANKFVVLFPEVGKSALNPLGCWDWWGYTGPDFLTRDAAQITAVHRMLSRLARPAAPN